MTYSNASRKIPAAEAEPSMDDRWKRVCRRLRAELGDAKFDSWFARIELDRIDANAAHLSVPTKFLKSWIQLHYLDRIRAILATEMPEIVEIDIRVRSSSRPSMKIAREQDRAPSNPAALSRGTEPPGGPTMAARSTPSSRPPS